MKKLKLIYLFILCTAFCSCDFKCSVGDNKSGAKAKTFTSKDNTTLNGAIIKNNIYLDATGVKLKEAYPVGADYNLLKENVAAIGEKIYLVIKMDTGGKKSVSIKPESVK